MDFLFRVKVQPLLGIPRAPAPAGTRNGRGGETRVAIRA